MKSLLLSVFFFLTLVSALFAEESKDDTRRAALELDRKTSEVLDTFRTDFVNALSTGIFEKLKDYYHDNVRLMPDYQKTVLGRNNVMAYHRAFFARFQVKSYHRTKKLALTLGGRVVEIGLFEMKLLLKRTGQEFEITGKYLDLWAKEESDRMSLITSAWNYDRRLEISEEFKFAEVPAVQTALQAHCPMTAGISFELAALNKFIETAIAQHDYRLWLLLYTDDAQLLASYEPYFKNRKALEDYLDAHVKQLPVFEHLDIRNDQIDDQGSYVFEYASHVASWRDGDSSGVSTGKDLRIWRREQSGALRLYIQIGGYD